MPKTCSIHPDSSIKPRLLTDRQTDTDRHTPGHSQYRASVASRGQKNRSHGMNSNTVFILTSRWPGHVTRDLDCAARCRARGAGERTTTTSPWRHFRWAESRARAARTGRATAADSTWAWPASVISSEARTTWLWNDTIQYEMPFWRALESQRESVQSYRTEPTTKKCKNRKTKKERTDMLRNNSKQSGESM